MNRLLHLVGERFAAISAYTAHSDSPQIKLDANESPWSLPADLARKIVDELTHLELNRYPDAAATELRHAIATRVGARESELVLGTGSDEVIGLMFTTLDRGRNGGPPTVVFPGPSFVMIPIAAQVHGFVPVEVPLTERWDLDLPRMLDAIERHRPNLIFLASPNNPTGNAFSPDAIQRIVEVAQDSLVVLDEAYAPFDGVSRASWVDAHANVAVLGTLSKIGLAGLRVGWVRVRSEIAIELEKARPPYNLNAPAQRLATAILTRHASVLDTQIAQVVAERERLRAGLEAIDGMEVFPSAANFVLVRVTNPARVHEDLLRQSIRVRRFASHPRLSEHLRITVGTPSETEALLSALRALPSL